MMVYSDVSNKQVCSHQNIFVIFQPTQPFLLQKNEQGGDCYHLVPCLFIKACFSNRDTRVLSKASIGKEKYLNFRNTIQIPILIW